MFSLCLSVISLTGIVMTGDDSQTLGCIQPGVEVVHVDLRLIDLPDLEPGTRIELSLSDDSVVALPEQNTVRLKLQPGELIRLWKPDGPRGDWFDPLQSEVAPEAEETPAWAMGAVWYNVFPERFDNAVAENDQGWPHGTRMPWSGDWFEVTPDEFEASVNRAIGNPGRYRDDPDRRRPTLADVVFERRYGGDLQGVQRRLDHIKSLGATAIWLCPVFESVSLHKYDATDHRHIDPYLADSYAPNGEGQPFTTDASRWAWTPADKVFVNEFLPAAKSRGFRVILDGVWNHAGTAHPAFQDAIDRGRASPYFDWFDLQTDAGGRVHAWRAWDRRNGNLPAFKQIDGDLVLGPKKYAFDVTSRWMDPNSDGNPGDGIDGWRLDVANEMGLPFWRDWRRHVRSLNPEAVLFGELWFDGRDYFGGNAFDAQMNYPLAFVLVPWLAGEPNPSIVDDLKAVYTHHPATELAQMNLLGSHDTARLVSMLANPGLGYDQGAGMGAEGYDRSRPSKEIFERLELAYAVLTALPGSPMIFGGDELGVWGADDPENRKPLPWPDLTGNEALQKLAHRTTSRVGSWLRHREDERVGEVLRLGAWDAISESGILIIERNLHNQVVRLYANANDNPIQSSIGEIPARSAKLVKRGSQGEWVTAHQSSE